MDVEEFRNGDEVLPKPVLTKPMGSNLYIKDAFIFPEKLDWYSAVGNFILNFGTLEMNFFLFRGEALLQQRFREMQAAPFQGSNHLRRRGAANDGFPSRQTGRI